MSIIEIQGLHYAYPSPGGGEPRWVLRGIDLSIEAGECVGLMGPTGVGKTTLCLALTGIVPQSTGGVIRGRARVLGMDTKHTRVSDLAARVGVVFQDPETQLFNLSVEEEVAFGPENLGLSPDEIGPRITWALDQVGILELSRRPPSELSGGEKQRLAIASILAMAPEVLVLDEPTANLDPNGKREVREVVRDLKRRRELTTVVVSQDADWLAEVAERIVVLDGGKVALDGPAQEVLGRTETLGRIGVAAPQMCELASELNRSLATNFAFTRLDEAELRLREALGG